MESKKRSAARCQSGSKGTVEVTACQLINAAASQEREVSSVVSFAGKVKVSLKLQ